MELSILIPARNEIFLKNTIEDILKNIRADTEVIVALDGEKSKPPLDHHERVTVMEFPESLGQRAAQNRCARIASGKYVMKVDAHCSFDEGFDRKMLDAFKVVGDDVTLVPVMRNLYAFDWVCENGHRRYQDKEPNQPCPECGTPSHIDLVWKAKRSPNSTSYRVNPDLEFKYFTEYKRKQEGDLVESMSLQGSCFMATKKNYWEKELCNESWGSWGGQGAEVALKTWLSGGRVLCNKKTWYAHMFRTKPGFSHPYPNPGNEQKRAKDSLRDTFLNNRWDKQTLPLKWLVKKFSPVPDWTDEDIEKLPDTLQSR